MASTYTDRTDPNTRPWFRMAPPWNCGDEGNETGEPSLATAMAITQPAGLIHYSAADPDSNPSARRFFVPQPEPVGPGLCELAAANMRQRIAGAV